MKQPSTIRIEIRAARRLLSAEEVRQQSTAICRTIRQSREFLAADRIALFLSNDNEPQPEHLIPTLWKFGKNCYLPILKPKPLQGLWFGHLEKNNHLVPNRFGILEPALNSTKLAHPSTLDIAYLPLVAFDSKGNRLGMGGGYYDRTFAYLRHRRYRRPRLIGLAFECQQVAELPSEPWDIPLDGVITETNYYKFER